MQSLMEKTEFPFFGMPFFRVLPNPGLFTFQAGRRVPAQGQCDAAGAEADVRQQGDRAAETNPGSTESQAQPRRAALTAVSTAPAAAERYFFCRQKSLPWEFPHRFKVLVSWEVVAVVRWELLPRSKPESNSVQKSSYPYWSSQHRFFFCISASVASIGIFRPSATKSGRPDGVPSALLLSSCRNPPHPSPLGWPPLAQNYIVTWWMAGGARPLRWWSALVHQGTKKHPLPWDRPVEMTFDLVTFTCDQWNPFGRDLQNTDWPINPWLMPSWSFLVWRFLLLIR